MSSTTDPDAATGKAAFIPLEANPELMTDLIHKLGVSNKLSVYDVYALDDIDLLKMVPETAHALLLVFPVSNVYESQRMAEDSLVEEYRGKGAEEPVVWWKQTITNACGMMALLHAVCNGDAVNEIEKDSTLDIFLKKSIDLPPHERSALLEKSSSIAAVHKAAASTGDSAVPDANADTDLHYVCFVKGKDGCLWELDGRRKGPINRGALAKSQNPADRNDVLGQEAMSLGALKFVQREQLKTDGGDKKEDFRFSAVALAQSWD